MRGNTNMEPLIGTIEYEYQNNHYTNEFFLDLEHYMTFYSSATEEEELLESIKNMNDVLKDIKDALYIQTKKREETY